MHRDKLDNIDITLIELLQQKARIKRGQLAEKVGLSIPTISERLHKLEDHGIIRGYHAVLEPRKVDLQITAFIFLITESSTYYNEIVANADARKEVLECHAITGKGSHLLKVRSQNTASLEKLLADIQSWPGVKHTMTDVVLSSTKETTELPLNHLRKQPDK